MIVGAIMLSLAWMKFALVGPLLALAGAIRRAGIADCVSRGHRCLKRLGRDDARRGLNITLR